MRMLAFQMVVLFYIGLNFGCGEKEVRVGSNVLSKGELLIAYNVLVDAEHDNYDIFTMSLDGSNKRNITNHPDVAWTYLASGKYIFFISDRDTTNRVTFLYEMKADGSATRRISDLRLRDSWMGVRKDGHELVVSPHPSVDSLLYLIDREGRVIQRLATGMPYATDPTFSPDGTKIAFIGKNRKARRDPAFKAEIYIMNMDGTNLKKLTQYPATDTTAEWFAYKVGPPRWHPEEDFITYQSKQNGKYSLYAVTPDGSKNWKLTNNPQEEGWHSWSPDGKWLAIELFDAHQTQFNIGLLDWHTKEMKVLTDSTYKYQQAPVFVRGN